MPMTEKLDPQNLPDDAQERARVARELKRDALAAQARGELITAMLHASDALMLFPNEREYLDLVDDLALATPDPLALVPVATGAVHVATGAARARILMMQKDLGAAIEIIGEIVAVAPDLAYLDWVRRWLQPHVVQALGWEFLVENTVKPGLRIALGVEVPPERDDPRLPNVASAADIMRLLRAAFPGEAVLYWGEALARRRLGDPSATVAVAQEGVQRFPSDDRVMLAMANGLRDARRPDEALQYYRRALQLDPEDNAPLHDAGWAFLDVGRPADALGLFQELLSRQPDYPEGKLSLHYARFKAHGASEDRAALIRLRERHWRSGRTRELVNEIDPPDAYFNVLPGPGDATAAATRELIRELAPVFRCCGQGANINYTLSSQYLDSPSVALAFDLAVRSAGGAGAALSVEIGQIQEPDPRRDKAQAPLRVWTYEGTNAQRVYPAAYPQAQQAIAALADQVYRTEVWDPYAAQIAQQFGGEWMHAFVGVLTDPPPPPEHGEFDPFIWTFRCQVAAALVLSHLGPWESGSARPALYSLIYGPSDWITAAGLIALAWRVRGNPGLRPEVEGVFQWMRSQIPQQGYTAWEGPLAHVWLGLGGHPAPVQAELEAWLERYYDELPRKNRVRPPERRFGGLTLAQYAEFAWERDRIMSSIAHQGTGAAIQAFVGGGTPPELVALCQRFGVPMRNEGGVVKPYIAEWQEAINANPELQEEFAELQRNLQFTKLGVNAQEVAALDEIRAGNMDMHLRMAQAQQAQRAVAEGHAGEPDPIVFPGQPVARLSDYVGILKGMQTGNMGILGRYGLDFMTYASVASAWGAKMAADAVLTEKFNRMMSG
jgi:tetratricopeptide (TPR) repeat protein